MRPPLCLRHAGHASAGKMDRAEDVDVHDRAEDVVPPWFLPVVPWAAGSERHRCIDRAGLGDEAFHISPLDRVAEKCG